MRRRDDACDAATISMRSPWSAPKTAADAGRKILQFRNIDRQQEQVVESGYGFDTLLRGIAGDERPRFVGKEGGEDAHRDAERDRGADRARVQHFGAEVGQLLRFVVRDAGYDAGI
jgi:hypothetical protein